MTTAANHAPQAHYRAELKAISRTNKAGERRRSIIAAAAYGSRSTIPDYRQDREWSYTRKRDLAHSEIMAPPGAPEWATDRTRLWNAVDAAEKRKDACTGRELVLSLPRELDHAGHVAAVRNFVARELTSRGLIADVNMHDATALDGEPNKHVHVYFGTRALDGDGFASKKLPWLSNPTDAAAEMEALRSSWAASINKQLALTGKNVRVSHLSREARADLAAAMMTNPARPLSERAAAARIADDLSGPAEKKIGHRKVAQARRQVRSTSRRERRKVELVDQLVSVSSVAAEVIDLRAARAARRAETAKALAWTPADDARLERSKAPAPVAAPKPRKPRPSEIKRAELKLVVDRGRLDAAGARLDRAADRKIEALRDPLARTWAEYVEFCAKLQVKLDAEARAKAERETRERQIAEAARRQAVFASAAVAKPAQKPPVELLPGDTRATLIVTTDRREAEAVQEIERGWSRPRPGALIISPALLAAGPPAKIKTAIERHQIFGPPLAAAKHLIRLATDAAAPLIAAIWPGATVQKPIKYADFIEQLAADRAAREREQRRSLAVALDRWPRLLDQLDPAEREAWRDDLREIADELATMEKLALGAIEKGDNDAAWAAIDGILARVDEVARNVNVDPQTLDDPTDDAASGYRPT